MASEMEVDLASHRIVRAAPGFLGLIFGPGPYKTMFGPIIHFIHRRARWGCQLTATSLAAAVEWSTQQYEAALAQQYEESSSDEEYEEP